MIQNVWMNQALRQAYDRYSDNPFPRAYDPGNNMGNARYMEMVDYFKNRKTELTKQYQSYLELKKKDGDEWDIQAQKIKEMIPADDKPEFGYDTINYRKRYGHLKDMHAELSERFYAKFGKMRISYNTIKEFNLQLQRIFDDVAEEYNNQLGIQKLYKNQFYSTDGHILENIDLSDQTKSGAFSYSNTSSTTNKRQISEVIGSVGTVQSKINNILAMYKPLQNIISNYLDCFYPLFDTAEWEDGGFKIQ